MSEEYAERLEEVQELIAQECDAVKNLLLEKNRKYGNSAVFPRRIFSRQDAVEQIKVRIDDKLSRIQTSGEGVDQEDTVQDLLGYLILLRVAQQIYNQKNSEETFIGTMSKNLEEL